MVPEGTIPVKREIFGISAVIGVEDAENLILDQTLVDAFP
jgi:hypothetical protein